LETKLKTDYIYNAYLKVGAEYLIIAATMVLALWINHPVAWVTAWVVVGLCQHGLLVIGHMAAHKLVDGNPRLIHFLGMGMMGIDWQKYRDFHFAHHRNLGRREADPEWILIKRYKSNQRPYRFITVVADLLCLHLNESVWLLGQMSTRMSILIYLLILSMALLLTGPIILLWPLSLMTWGQLLNRLRNRKEHDHLNLPGITLTQKEPSFIMKILLFPFDVWKHKEHHGKPVKDRRGD
jgi:fatty acid desaturase